MNPYELEIPPALKLPEIEDAVRAEEAGASKFSANVVTAKPGKPTNTATFEILAPGTVPKPLHFIKQGDPVPANTKAEWAGAMIVAGTNTSVQTYREQ